MTDSEEIEINIANLMKDINEQIWRFEQKYHTRPNFLKVGTYVYIALKQMSNTYVGHVDTEKGYLHTFMGLLLCDTPSVQDFSVEVF